MARKLKGGAIQSGTINVTQLSTTVVTNITQGGGPKVSSITYPNSATAAVNTGNQTVVITGTGFESGVQVYINGNAVPAVSRTNANSVTFTTPALGTGATYPIYVVNPDGGTAVFIPGMRVSAGPLWLTTSPLTSWGKSTALSLTLEANSDSSVTYSLAGGSSLPSGITLAANGLLSGTLTSPPASATTYNFTIVATDAENQNTSSAFSIDATSAIIATGGTVTNVGGYRIHTFTSSGSFAVEEGGVIDYLVIAGGGGGATSTEYASAGSGGGGGGGFQTGTMNVSSGITYTVTIGAGGAGGSGREVPGSQGGNTIFSGDSTTLTSYGGGGGGKGYQYGGWGGGAGGSGGGGGGGGNGGGIEGGVGVYPGSSYISVARQGYDGSSGHGPNRAGGGGGGAGESRDRYVYNANGANGAYSTISGTSVAYAGGGGGSGNGGVGGGGNTGLGPASNGTTNRGGGGGGYGTSPGQAGSGGSGVVIIRYSLV
jgi:hypothetical protein